MHHVAQIHKKACEPHVCHFCRRQTTHKKMADGKGKSSGHTWQQGLFSICILRKQTKIICIMSGLTGFDISKSTQSSLQKHYHQSQPLRLLGTQSHLANSC